jgi:peptidoglycan/xylan/chitin deacetylase (PgdA/CDA1 family)
MWPDFRTFLNLFFYREITGDTVKFLCGRGTTFSAAGILFPDRISMNLRLFSLLAVGLAASMLLLLFPSPGRGDSTDERKVISFSSGPAGSNAVALTFDDGPHPKLTPQLLEILKEEDVTATFFMLGSMIENYPAVARAVVDAGHEVANHTYSHERLPRLSEAKIREEIVRTQKLLEEAAGTKPRLFRAPYGSTNATVRDQLRDQNLELVGWAVDPRDWERGKTSASITAFILERSKGGDIILLHDIHSRSIAAVKEIIQGLKARGFTFTTAGDLIAQKREEMERLAEAAEAAGQAQGPGASSGIASPAQPALVPLGRSSLKRYDPATKAPAEP